MQHEIVLERWSGSEGEAARRTVCRRQKMLYQVGDKVVHPMHGAGVIDAIIQKKLNGVVREYYNLKLPVGSMSVLIPTDHTEEIGVRPVMDAARTGAVLDAMGNLDVPMAANWSRRYRDNMLKLKSGDLLEVAGVVKGLMSRDQDRGLSTQERKMLRSARQILISELVLSQNSTYEDMTQRVDHILEKKSKK